MSSALQKKVDKAEFVNLVSSIWHINMKKSNVIAGFETTGIWPLNKEKYNKSCFDIGHFGKYCRNGWNLENQN